VFYTHQTIDSSPIEHEHSRYAYSLIFKLRYKGILKNLMKICVESRIEYVEWKISGFSKVHFL
jgi:hypothetical protein